MYASVSVNMPKHTTGILPIIKSCHTIAIDQKSKSGFRSVKNHLDFLAMPESVSVVARQNSLHIAALNIFGYIIVSPTFLGFLFFQTPDFIHIIGYFGIYYNMIFAKIGGNSLKN